VHTAANELGPYQIRVNAFPWMAMPVGYRNWVETPDATIQRPYTLAGFAEFFNWTAGENENALFASRRTSKSRQ
jgi:hypothetical protein